MSSKVPALIFNPENVEGAKVQAAIKAAGATVVKDEAGVALVPLDEINVFPGLQARVATKGWNERVAAYAEDIKANGFDMTKPLVVFTLNEEIEEDGKPTGKKEPLIYIEDGHTRLAAVQAAVQAGAKVEKLPVIFRPSGWTPQQAMEAQVRDNSGEPLSAWEKATIVARMRNGSGEEGSGMSEDEIAKRLGMTKRYVQDLLVLSTATPAIRNAVIKGEIAASFAFRTIREAGDLAKAEKVISGAVEKAKAAGKKKATPSVREGRAKQTGKKPGKGAAPAAESGETPPAKGKEPAAPAKEPAAPAKEPAPNVPNEASFLRSALTFAADHGKPAEGVRWIKLFLAGDKDATLALEKFMGQPAGSYFDPTLRVAEDLSDL